MARKSEWHLAFVVKFRCTEIVNYNVIIVEVGYFTIEADGWECSTSDNSHLYVGNGEVKTFTLSRCRGRYLKLKKSQPIGLSLCRVKVMGHVQV